jgi:hypothetical protein
MVQRRFRNPFTRDYLLEELAFLDVKDQDQENDVMIQLSEPRGRLDDYLNKNWRVNVPSVPMMFIDGKIWMSLTFMEVQSAALAIQKSCGDVVTGGLGLGYYVARAAAQDEVDTVTVYEINRDVVSLFMRRFKDRSWYKKVIIVCDDIRKKIERDEVPHADFFFMDIYQTMLPDEVIDDARSVFKRGIVEPNCYHFWGQECPILDAMVENEPVDVEFLERAYFKYWMETDEDDIVLHNLYDPHTDFEFRDKILVMLKRREEGDALR